MSSVGSAGVINFYYFDLEGIPSITASLVAGGLLLAKINKVANDHFPTFEDSKLSISLILAGSCVIGIGSIYAPTVVLTVNAIALMFLYVATKESLSSCSYLIDMTKTAKKKPFKKYRRADETIRSLEAVLNRTETPNAILVGPAGVGKTAIIETLAQKIADNTLSSNSPFRGKKILKVSLTNLVEGTYLRGDMASRIANVVKMAKDPSTIIFIDEIHLINQKGSYIRGNAEDPAQLLKPELDRDDITVIGATTIQEYTESIATDAALARRFVRVDVRPPNEKECFQMLKDDKASYQTKYQTTLTDEAIAAAVIFASRQPPRKALPYSAVNIILNVCSQFTPENRPPSITAAHITARLATDYPNGQFYQQALLSYLSEQSATLLGSANAAALS